MSYTATNPYITFYTFPGLVSGDLDFSSIVSNEVDYGTFTSFTDYAPFPGPGSFLGMTGIVWGGYQFGVSGPDSSTTITLNYNVSEAAGSGNLITSAAELLQVDSNIGPGTSATATESVYDSSNNLIGTVTWSAANGTTTGSINLSAGYQQVNVVLTINESIDSTGTTTSSNGPGSQISVSVLGQYFGETPVSQLASISSNVFCDENDTGIYAPGDFGLSGVTVELLNSTGTQVLQTTTTDSNGNYSFSNLTAGTYKTQVEIPTGSGDQYSTANQGLDTVTLTPGEADNASQTGLFMPAVVGVNVYFDANDIGTYVPGDTELPGVTVDLFNLGTSQGQTVITDVNGNATFTGLLPGVYEVLVAAPTGDTVTQAVNVGTLLTLESCGTVNAIEGVYGTNTGGGGLPATPAIEILKTVTSVGGTLGDPAATYAGETIDYSVVVTNIGTENLTDVVVTDPTLGIALGTLATMAAGTSVTYSATATVTQAELDSNATIANTAVVTDDQTTPQSSTATTNVSLTPGVSIVKSVTSVGGVAGDPAATVAGEVIDYQIVVANIGDETLTNVAVTDPMLGVAYATLASLAVGASVTYTASATVTQAELDAKAAVPNTAVVTDDQTTPQSSTVSTTVSLTPGVSIVKSVTSVGGVAGDPAATVAGEVIDYQIVVANTGDETLTNVAVTDPTLGVAYATLASLAVGASVTYTASATVTQAELDAKAAVPNTAVVTDDQTTPQSSTVSTNVSLTPGVSIVKSVTSVGGVAGDPAATVAGEVIDYQVVIANTGDETLTNVAVTDPTLGVAYATLASLAVGASVTYTASATVTQAELDAKAAVPNTAVVTDDQTTPQSSTVSTNVSLTPGVSIVKSVTSVGGVAGDPAATVAGEVIDYQIVVANTGDETLTNVAVTDPTLGVAYATLASLAVGASVTCTASATVTQAELDAKAAVPNTAVVTDSQTPSQSSTVSTTVSLTPGVSIVKSVTSVGGVAGDPAATVAGEVIDYQIVIANTGDETLTNVAVTDPTLGVAYATLASLAVGASVTYTASATVTQAELDAKAAVPNTAVVTDDQTPSQSSTVSTNVSLTPSVSIVKSVTSVGGVAGDPAATVAGEVIDYQIVVANTGDETLTNVAVTDPTLGVAYATLASLAVGASVTYTASATVTQAELDAKAAVPNTAVVTDDQTTPQSSTVSTTVSLTPGVSIVKSVTSVGGVAGDPAATVAGEVIDYQIVVANTGDETLTNVAVTDPTLGVAYATLASLAVGASVTYTASATVTQAELDAKAAVPNTAVVTDDQTTPQSSTVSTTVSLTPGVSIVKSVTSVGGVAGDPAATVAGEVIDYQIVIANTGDETLTNVAVTDPTLGVAYATLASLAVGASVTYTASATVTQAELDAKAAVPNTAVVTDDQTPSQSSTVSTNVSLTPSVSIVKSVTSVGGVAGDPAATVAGEVIDYQIVVANTGDETLTNVAVTDPTLGVAYATLASLAVGASVTYTASATVTQAELDAKAAVPNTAVVTDDQTTPQSSTVSTTVSLTPGVSIVKSVTSVGGVAGDPAATVAGEVIDYQIVVANTGDETLTNVAVTDPTLGVAYATLASLAVGASVTYTASATVTQAELDAKAAVPNTAVVTDDQTTPQSSTVSTTVSLTPSVSIVKSVTSVGGVAGDPAATVAGEVIDYKIVVANTGDETLTNVAVTDPTLGVAYATLASLAVGASVTYTASATVTQAELDAKAAVPNTAVVTDSQTPSQSSTVSTNVSLTPGVSIVKSVTSVGGVAGDPAATVAGEVIDYKIVVANTGDETLTNVAVTDPTLGVAYATLASLAVGASVTYTASATVTQAELDAKAAVPNTAVVTDSQTPSQSSTVSTNVSLTPGVSIVKSVTSVGGVAGDPAATVAGEVIDYKIVVANTGDETLTNVAVTDPTLGVAYATLASLAVGASVTYTASATVTQAELDAKAAVPNTAVVTDSQTPSQSSTVSTNVSLTPGVSIVKSVTSVGGVAGDPAATFVGEVIDYQIVVANTGDETLTNVVVTDQTLGKALGTLASLAVGASVTYTASQTVTQAEIDGCNSTGTVTNTATVTDSQTPTASSTASTNLTAAPGVSIVKSVTSVGGVAGDPAATVAGEVIDYKIVVTNTGNETLTNVLVNDTTLGTPLGTLASLAVGATATYTASQTVTQAELDNHATVINTATVTDTQNMTGTSTVSTGTTATPGVSIVKTVTSVGGVSGDPTATYAGEAIDYKIVVTNTGSETLTNVVVDDTTLGTVLGTLASLAVGATATYTVSQAVTQAELDQGQICTTSPSSSQTCSVSTNGLGSGCTAWLNSSFKPTSCQNGATYNFQNISCTVTGPYCGTATISLPNACVTFSSSCAQATTVYNASTNCWNTTLPAGCNPGNVFLTGLPCQVPSGYNLTGATLCWTIGQSANNCGSSNVSWQTGCQGYNNFSVNGCNGLTDYNQIGVQVCDNLSNYGSSGACGGSSGCAGTPVTQCCTGNCGCGTTGTGTCGNGSGSGSISCVGSITNTATVTDSQGVTGTSTASTSVTQSPGVSIVKSVTSVGGVSGDPMATYAGEVIKYSVVVSNSGSETLTNVVVTDTTLGTTLGTIATMAPGASQTYTASQSVTQSELNSSNSLSNTATVTDTQNVTGSSTASTTLAHPGVSIVKTVTSVGGVSGDPAATYAGEVIDYKILVTNTGTEPLTNVLVTDTTLGKTLGTIASLAAGSTATYTASQTVTQTEIDQSQVCSVSPSNTQTCAVSGSGLGSGCAAWLNSSFTPTSCANGATYTFQNISCTITGPNCGTLTESVPNACVTFSNSCTQATTVYNSSQNCWITTLPANCNPGNVFLSGLPCQVPWGCNLSGATITWNIGQSANNCGSSGVSWQTSCQGYNSFYQNGCNGLSNYNNIGVQVCDNLTGYGNGGNCYSSSSCAGTPVNQWTSGNCGSGSSGSGTCGNGSGSGTLCCVGAITNTATVTDSQGVTGTSTASTAVTQTPGVSIVKSVTSVGGVSGDPAATYAGEFIKYSVVVTNSGDETLTNVLVTDTTLGTALGTLASLAPGASATYTVSQTVTQTELNSGSAITNTATVTDTQNVTASSTASTAITQTNGISIVKSASLSAVYAGGTAVSYTYVLTNVGDTSLSNVKFTDVTNGNAGTAYTISDPSSLAPGATFTYTTAPAAEPYPTPTPFTDLIAAGAAPGSYAVLGLGGLVNLSLVTVTGNVGTGAGGSISNAAPSKIIGNVYEAAAGQYSGPGSLTGSVTVNSSLLSSEVAGAKQTAADAKALTATQTFAGISSATTITGVAGLNVIQVNGNINLNNANLTLSGPSNAYFVIDVTGNVTLTGTASLLASGGVTDSDILYNLTASNAAVNTHVGDTTDGILLAAGSSSSMTLDGTFNGELIGTSISLLSNAALDQTGAPSAPAAYGVTDVATASGTAPGGSTVTASTSAQVEVVAPAGTTTIGTSPPAAGASLFTTYGAAADLEFAFNPGTTVSTQSQGSGTTIATASLGLPSSPAFILISNNASDSASAGTDYYEGLVTAGSKLYANATATLSGVPDGGAFSTVANADLYVHIFSSQAAFLAGAPAQQELKYDTSGAHGMSLGDTIGSLQLIGYESTTGHGYLVS